MAFQERYADPQYYPLLGLGPGVFFDKETFGEDRLVKGKISAPGFLEQAPLSNTARRDILRLETDQIDYLPGLSSDEKKARLSQMSYHDYLLDVVKVDPSVIRFIRAARTASGSRIDAVSALDVWPFGLPGFQGLKLDPGSVRISYTPAGYADGGSYQFHFPDGNASIARLLVRSDPASLAGRNGRRHCASASTTAASIGRVRASAHRLGSLAVSVVSYGPTVSRPQSRWSIREPDDFTSPAPTQRTGLLEHDDPVLSARNCQIGRRRRCISGQCRSFTQMWRWRLAGLSHLGRLQGLLPGCLPLERSAQPGHRCRFLSGAPIG